MRLLSLIAIFLFHIGVNANASEHQCGDIYLGAIAINDSDLGKSSTLPAQIDDKRREAIDRYITNTIARDIWNCLLPTFNIIFNDIDGNDAKYTNDEVYYFPGNNFSYGKVYTSADALSYFNNGQPFSDGSIIKKISFELDGYAQTGQIEAAIIKKTSGSWEWYKINEQGIKLRSDAECLSCHIRVRERDYLFGITDVMKIR